MPIKQYFIPTSVWPHVISMDAAEGEAVKPSAHGEYHAIAGALADGTLTVNEPGSLLLPSSATTLSAPAETYVNGRFGQAYASGGAAKTGAPIIPGGDFSIECWIRANSVPSGTEFIIGESERLMISLEAGTGRARLSVWSSQTNKVGQTALADGVWHHLACTYDATGAVATLYVDGQKEAELAKPMAGGVGDPFTVGGWGKDTRFPFLGEIDEAAMFDGVRYSAPFTPPSVPLTTDEPGLMALWHFDGALDGAA